MYVSNLVRLLLDQARCISRTTVSTLYREKISRKRLVEYPSTWWERRMNLRKDWKRNCIAHSQRIGLSRRSVISTEQKNRCGQREVRFGQKEVTNIKSWREIYKHQFILVALFPTTSNYPPLFSVIKRSTCVKAI
jgi:hypothetical protein